MIKTKKVMKEQEEIVDIICNNCGKSCKKGMNYVGLIETKVQGSYDSEKIEDGTSLTFSICEDCLDPIIKKFKVSPEKKEESLF